MDDKIRCDLEKQGYRLVGSHSAIKVCLWCKRSITGKDVCYKNTFYGIKSHRCIQASVSLLNCLHKCKFCWRTLDYTLPADVKNPDNPKFILDSFVKEQRKYLQGFGGNEDTQSQFFEEAMNPKHVALSLAGDATMYPLLPELVDEISERKMTSFIVTNGMRPEMLQRLIAHEPTQVYVTLPAPNKVLYQEVCNPFVGDGWKRLAKSLDILQNFKRSTVRLTLLKGMNMLNPEEYAKILDPLDIKFVELKAGMPVGYAQYRVPYESMPRHFEIKDFAENICKNSSLKIIDEKENSRVVLLAKKDFIGRKLTLR